MSSQATTKLRRSFMLLRERSQLERLRTLDSNDVILDKASSRQDRKTVSRASAAGRGERLSRRSTEESDASESITHDWR